jgi:pimeloyl-ACP methyl ester carboxylesterase
MTRLTIALLLILANCTTKNIDIENDGVKISYTDSEAGNTTLLFVHGWCIDKSYWTNQISFFSPKYRVVTVDLPGFGSSGKNRNVWTVEDYGEDIAKVIKELKLKNVILIGHSFAGEIIVETANNSKDSVVGLICIDGLTTIGRDLTKQDGLEEYFVALRSGFKEVGKDYMKSLFYGVSDSITINRVLSDFDKTDSSVAISSLEQNVNYSAKVLDKLKETNLKLYLINSDKNTFDSSSLKAENLAFKLTTINSTGHFPMIEKPNEFNKQLKITVENILN